MPTPQQFPASLDPNVHGDGRPLQRGDIVRHRGDPTTGEWDAVVASELGNRLVLAPFGSRSSHLTGADGWQAHLFVLVRRPAPGDYTYVPPALLHMGLAGQYPDLEFAQGVAEWLGQVARGEKPVAWRDAMAMVKRFCSAKHSDTPGTDYTVVDIFNNTDLSGGDTKEVTAHRIFVALTNVFNTYDASILRCLACAKVGQARPYNSPDCQHYECGVCGDQQTSERCRVCEELRGAGICVCASCCSHVACTEVGYEEIMLSADRCPTCKRGPKGCKCPGCEVAGCFNKTVRPCCGGCTAHCTCASMCMRHTGMRRLVKFAAPPGEKGMTRLLGTEIETYGSAIRQYSPKLRKAVEAWQASVITDGSIGGRGVELVTQPAGGSQWRQMIADLGEGFKESQSISRDTCGLHMHADCSDVDGMALKRIIKLYAHIEFCLYDAIPLDRQTGNYSAPNGAKLLKWLDNDCAKFDAKMEAGEQKKLLSYIQYGLAKDGVLPKLGEPWLNIRGEKVVATATTIKTITNRWDEVVASKIRSKGDPNRYSGLNMHSYWLRGTLEFRHHHGTNDPVKITNWGFVIGSIVDYCVKHTDEDLGMLVGLEPRLSMAMLLEEMPEVLAWLESRWDLFTTAHKQRREIEPTRSTVTGEV